MGQLFSNNGKTTLASPVDTITTSIVVVDASKFPVITGGNTFKATLENLNRTAVEIVEVTAVVGNTLTVVRAQEGTVATAFDAGSFVEGRLTAGWLNDIGTKLGPVSATELGYLDGVTSSIQTQINTKEPTITTLPVSKGGTGVGALTGLVKGNGTSAMTAAVAGTDYVIPSGSITGNAATATTLQTARTINGVSFNGSANITIADSTKIPTTEKGAANGVATLDANGKVPTTQIPDSVLGQLEYMGTHNFTAMPTATQKGQYWIASVAGNGYEIGDWAVYNGVTFDKVDNTDAVSSVAGRTGNVVLTKSDVGLNLVDNTADVSKNVATAATWTTARTITIGNTGKSVNGSSNVSWSLAEIGAQAAGNYQPLDADLTAIAGLAGTSGFLKKTATDTWALDTSTYLTGNQSIAFTGDATGSGTTSVALTLANSGVTAGTYNNSATTVKPIVVDAKGRITGVGTDVTITPAFSSITGKPTTLAGYGITDAATSTHNHTIDSLSNVVITANSDNEVLAWDSTTSKWINQTAAEAGLATSNHTHLDATTSVSGFMSGADKTKLDGIATGANNYSHPTGDGNLHVPATGTTNAGKVLTAGSTAGSLSWTTIPAAPVSSVAGRTGAITLTKTDVGLGNVDNTADSAKAVLSATKLATARTINGVAFDGTANITINAVDSTARIAATEKGTANGVATLGADGKVPSTQLPSYVDDVLEFTNLAGFPTTGESGKIYVALDTNKTYRWSGSAYTQITSGAVDSVAGKTGVVTLVKADVGLGNVDNTSDANKPISTAVQTALDTKLASASYTAGDVLAKIKTVDGAGSGLDADLLDGQQGSWYAPLASPAFTGTPTGTTAAVGTNTTQLATTAFVQAEIANDAPTKTGTGASGTWGISITGNAATATNADTVDGYHVETGNTPASGLVKVGDFGFNGGIGVYLPSGDCNNLDINTSVGVVGSEVLNCPTSGGVAYIVQTFGAAELTGGKYQLATNLANGITYTRYLQGAWSSWQVVYTSGNDGAGSGLDADLLDGIDSTGFTRNFGSVTINPAGSYANCTTEQFITWLTNLGAFNFKASVMKCSWDYAGNNDISDTGFGQLDLAGCIVETFGDLSAYIIRVTSPSTGTGSGGIHEYVNHGSGYGPGWRRVYTSSLNGNITGNAETATKLATARTINGVAFDGTADIVALPARLTSGAQTISDWNLAIENGWYQGYNIPNAPNTDWNLGIVEAHNSLWVTQTVHSFTQDISSNSAVWRRNMNNGTWSNWYRLQLTQEEQDARYVGTTGAGATGTWGISISGNAATADKVNRLDTRDININPYSYVGLSLHLKKNLADGLVDGGNFHGVLNLAQWGDSAGGKAHQLAFTDNSNIYHRTTADGTTFSSWAKLWSSANDGSGSGLDADLLDGIDSSGFAKVGGNSGALTIGTNDANALTLETNGTPRVTVDAYGSKVTQTPSQFEISASGGLAQVYLNGTAQDATRYKLMQGIPGISNSGFTLWDETANSPRVTIDPNGNVGIGTSSPSTKLTMDAPPYGTGDHASALSFVGTTTTAAVRGYSIIGNAGVGMYSNSYTHTDGGISASNGSVASSSVTTSPGWIEFRTAPAGVRPEIRAAINSSGNILIGTTTDNGHKLQVAGSMTVSRNPNSQTLIEMGPEGDQWVLIGRFINSYSGAGGSADLDIHAGYGYNGDINQRLFGTIRLRWGNPGVVEASVEWVGGTQTMDLRILAANNASEVEIFGLYPSSYYIDNSVTPKCYSGNIRFDVMNLRRTDGASIAGLPAIPSKFIVGSNLLIGTTTDNGVDKLQVNGSIRTSSSKGAIYAHNGYTPIINSTTDNTLAGYLDTEASITDLNNLTTSGTYNGIGLANAPVPGWIFVQHMQHSNTTNNAWAQQIATTMGAANTPNQMYIRTKVHSTWSAWRDVIHDANLQTYLDSQTINGGTY